MRRYLTGSRLFGSAAFGAALVLVVLAAVVVTLDEQRLRSTFGWVQHTQQVLLEVDRVQSNLAAAIAAQRGYRLDQQPEERTAFLRAARTLRRQIDVLGPLVADNPEQVSRLAELRQLVEDRLTVLGSAIGLADRRIGATAPASPPMTTRQALIPIASVLARLRSAELDLLAKRQRTAAQAAVASNRIAIVTFVLALGTAVLGILLLERVHVHARTRELQAELFHVARQSTAGQTAAMLSHELKQPLSAAHMFLAAALRLLATEGAPRERAVEALQRSMQQVDRAGEIIRRVREFLRRSGSRRTIERVGGLIADTIVIAALDQPGISVTQRLAADLPPVLVDKVEIQQVLINLMRNGIEAMSQSERKELALSAVRSDQDMVEIAVCDAGSGLPKEVAAKLFQPFVTTKPGGMGVGLSICRQIVEAHGGRIWVDTDLPVGTAFRFTVPIAAAAGPAGDPSVEASDPLVAAREGRTSAASRMDPIPKPGPGPEQ